MASFHEKWERLVVEVASPATILGFINQLNGDRMGYNDVLNGIQSYLGTFANSVYHQMAVSE